ncbi:MAG: threonylcarbamoyl-AMP synthase [Bacteroidetes bacterium]|nr:threonylcarbamoyl-AMP synthase [Bacteroidota bacterium]
MIGTDLSVAKQLLEADKLVAIPTETVYGLAANALHPTAVLSIYKAKNRPSFDPLIVHVNSVDWVKKLTLDIPKKAQELMDSFWPGPLTLILPKSAMVPDIVTSGLGFVGVRMPRHPLTKELLSNLDFPLAAPSANPFSYVSPTTAQHVEDQLGNKVDYIIDGGPCVVGLESTIVSFETDIPKILRFGGIDQEAIEKVIGSVDLSITNNSNPTAPGQLDKHYATGKPTYLVNQPYELLLFNQEDVFTIGYGEGLFDYNLSPTTDLDEMAQNLFTALRLADKSKRADVAISVAPHVGIGKAINDRLNRASKD